MAAGDAADLDARLRGFFLKAYDLKPEELERLGLFLLAHTFLDRHMIHFLALMEAYRSTPPVVTEAGIDALIAKHSDGTFLRHLNAIRDQGLLGLWYWQVCEEVNRGRDHFIHWRPGRFATPKYEGVDVVTPEGLSKCLQEVFEVIVRIVGGEDDEIPWVEHLRSP